MACGKHEHARLAPYLAQRDARGGDRRPDQGDITAAIQQPGRRAGQVEAAQGHLDLRVRLLEGAEHGGPDLGACGAAEADRQSAGNNGGRVPGRRHAAVEPGQRIPGGDEERLARRRQRHAPDASVQQPGADSPFELPDLGAEHLLGNVHPARGGGEALRFGDRDEVPQVPQLDVHRPPIT